MIDVEIDEVPVARQDVADLGRVTVAVAIGVGPGGAILHRCLEGSIGGKVQQPLHLCQLDRRQIVLGDEANDFMAVVSPRIGALLRERCDQRRCRLPRPSHTLVPIIRGEPAYVGRSVMESVLPAGRSLERGGAMARTP